jgi:SAM-dependent methyltransferase
MTSKGASVPDLAQHPERIREAVRERYAAAARLLEAAEPASCCEPGDLAVLDGHEREVFGAELYEADERGELPDAAVLASLGCGNPTAVAELHAGETVLDLGSGGGIDVLLSARRVGPTGKAYGLDMTDEMLALARANAARAGATNVEFLKGQIERIPLPDASVDVIISNCVINLSGDKRATLAEAFRVLRPGGRFAVSDVVVQGTLPSDVKRSMELWVGCVAGALEDEEFLALLRDVGFESPSLVHADGVVAAHHGLGPELTQVLDQVVDERVVVVDDEDPAGHRLRSYRLALGGLAWSEPAAPY